MKKIMIFAILLAIAVVLLLTSAEGFEKYAGETEKDLKLAKELYNSFHEAGVVAVEVHQSIMWVHVSYALYGEMFYNRLSGNKTMRLWQKAIAKNGSSSGIVGTVYLLVDGDEVAECSTAGMLSSRVNIKWHDD